MPQKDCLKGAARPPHLPTTTAHHWLPAAAPALPTAVDLLQSSRGDPPSVSGLLQAHKQQKAAAAAAAAAETPAPSPATAGERGRHNDSLLDTLAQCLHSAERMCNPRACPCIRAHPTATCMHITAARPTSLCSLFAPVLPASPPQPSLASQTCWPRRRSCWGCSWTSVLPA